MSAGHALRSVRVETGESLEGKKGMPRMKPPFPAGAEFGRVRVRGEVGRVSRPGSGHLYFDLKDDRAYIAAVTWKGQAARLSTRPEEGIEVIEVRGSRADLRPFHDALAHPA